MKPASIPHIIFIFSLLPWVPCFFSSSQPHANSPNNQKKITKRCTFIDDAFAVKDCGHAPTEAEFESFVQKQEAEVVERAKTNPCGFTSCPKFKRDLEFNYRSQSNSNPFPRSVPSKVNQDLQPRAAERHLKTNSVKRDSRAQARPRPVDRRQLLAPDLRYKSKVSNSLRESDNEDLRSRRTTNQDNIFTLVPGQVRTTTLFTDHIPVASLPDGILVSYSSVVRSDAHSHIREPLSNQNATPENFSSDDKSVAPLDNGNLTLVSTSRSPAAQQSLESEPLSFKTRQKTHTFRFDSVPGVELKAPELIARNVLLAIGRDGKQYLLDTTRIITLPSLRDFAERIK